MNPAQFVDPTYIMFAKLILALLLGGLIGTERAVIARQAVGTRTFGLVALGACLLVITGNYVNNAYLGVVNIDPPLELPLGTDYMPSLYLQAS